MISVCRVFISRLTVWVITAAALFRFGKYVKLNTVVKP